MTILFSKIKTQFKRIYAVRLTPHQYWILVLRIFLVTCILLVIGNFYVLYQIKTQQIFQIKRSPTASTIDANLLQKVQDSLNKKAQTQETIKESRVEKDPSL